MRGYDIESPSTCNWLLEQQEYREWLDLEYFSKHHGCLWSIGEPGIGKSTLMKFASLALEEAAARRRQVPCRELVLAFFLDPRSSDPEGSITNLFRSLLFSLLENYTDLQTVLDAPVTSSPEQLYVPDGLRTILCDALRRLGNRQFTCFVDTARQSRQVGLLLEWIQHIVNHSGSTKGRVRFCVSCRHSSLNGSLIGSHVMLENAPSHLEALKVYVERRLNDPRLKTEVIDRAHGNFSWAEHVIKDLNNLDESGMPVRDRLNELPADLHELLLHLKDSDAKEMAEELSFAHMYQQGSRVQSHEFVAGQRK